MSTRRPRLRAPAPKHEKGAPGRAPRYRLRLLSGRAKGITFPIDAPQVRVGRGPGVDLVLHDRSLRRVHATMEPHDGCVLMRTVWPDDTFLWRGRAVRQACPVPGDVVEFGEVVLQLEHRPESLLQARSR